MNSVARVEPHRGRAFFPPLRKKFLVGNTSCQHFLPFHAGEMQLGLAPDVDAAAEAGITHFQFALRGKRVRLDSPKFSDAALRRGLLILEQSRICTHSRRIIDARLE
jgi:hypothetical protein